MLTLDDVEPAAIAGQRRFATGEDDELDPRGEALGVFPMGKGVPLIAAHDPEEAGGGKHFRHRLSGKVRVGRAGLMEFVIMDHGPWQMSGGEAKHCGAVLAVGARRAGFVRRNGARQEADFIESEGVPREGGEVEMPEVDGIKGAAKESDFARGCHGLRSKLYRRREM